MVITGARRGKRRSPASGDDEPAAQDAVRSWLESGAWTEELYFALPQINHFIELSDGQLIVPDMPSLRHQRVVRRFLAALERWNGEREGGEVVLAPYPVRLWPGKVREPDIAYYLSEHLDRLGEQRGGPPDVAVEVLSPSTRQTDLADKLTEYARAGIAEYWVVDPDEDWIEVRSLTGVRYGAPRRFLPGDAAASALMDGFTIDTAALLDR
jgi:Uma2 family endonuclease